MASSSDPPPRAMDAVRWERVQALFHAAADLEPDPQRALLQEECVDDPSLRSEVEAMLREDAAGRSLLDGDRADLVSAMLQSEGEIRSGQFGPYRLIRPLGEGGAGVVYLARRDDLQTDVAIKFLRDAWLSPARRERFAREQRMLAQLNHPAIARLYDAGTLANGTPWFVMEYVDGATLDLFCERLPTTETRVRIFRAVCEAVAFAHAHGVVHRDLKPSNVLVKADGSIRLLDFGIARQISESEVPPNQTRTGLRLLTPAYASPEQIRGEAPTVSTDIYSLGVILYQLVAGQLPYDVTTLPSAEALSVIGAADIPAASALAARREATPLGKRVAAALDLLSRTAMHPDRQRRYRSVEALLADVDRWLQRDSLTARPDPPWHVAVRWLRRRPAVTAAVATIVAMAAVGLIYVRQRGSAVPASAPARPITTRSVAVLPFQREGDDDRLDYLRFALPDEVATILSHVRYVSVRPSALTNRYAQPGVDAQKAGRDLRVSTVVTGHFLRAADMLHLTLEAIDVESHQLLWRDQLQVPANNLVATQVQLAFRVQGGLATAIGRTNSTRVKAPNDEEAYELFLKTSGISLDPASNTPALRMLERSVQLDPDYSPAWVALARRYYVESRYGGGADTLERYNAALKTAVTIDPEYVAAASDLILGRVEDGDLLGAYAAALDLTRRRPDSMETHFALSYVLRFAGLVDEAAAECDTAFLLDPRAQTAGLRSCASVFMLRGDYLRAATYADLDHGSDFAKAMNIQILGRQRRETEALRLGSPRMPGWNSYDMLLACMAHRPAAEIEALASPVRESTDPETNYFVAEHFAYCGLQDKAITFLTAAVRGNFCGYPAIQADPYFAGLRTHPQFKTVLAAAENCHSRFVAGRNRGTTPPRGS